MTITLKFIDGRWRAWEKRTGGGNVYIDGSAYDLKSDTIAYARRYAIHKDYEETIEI